MVWSKTHGITIASVSEWFQHLALKPTLNPSNDPCAPRLRWPKRRFAKFITTVAKSSQREETHARTLKLPNQNNPRAGCSIMGGWTPGAWTIPGSYSWAYQLALTQLVKMVLASVRTGPVACCASLRDVEGVLQYIALQWGSVGWEFVSLHQENHPSFQCSAFYGNAQFIRSYKDYISYI